MTSKTKKGLKGRLWKNILRTRPWIVVRIFATWLLFSPWFLVTVIASSWKAGRWSRRKNCLDFVKKHERVFGGLDPDSLEIASLSGGVSNSNHFWHFRRKDGSRVTYFAKVFVPVGTFWAKNLSLVSPFPEIPRITARERFAVDIATRTLLAERGIAVPRLVVYDAGQQILLTEYIEGRNVDEILQAAGKEESLSAETEKILRECAGGLGKIHRLGYSLVDTQPINCIWAAQEGRVYFTDLEFCTQADKRVWDVSFFLCFVSIRLPGGLKVRAQEIFLEEYRKESGAALKDLDAARDRLIEYIPVFQTVLDIRQFKPEEILPELMSGEV